MQVILIQLWGHAVMYWSAVDCKVWRDVNSQVSVHQAWTLDCSEIWDVLQKLALQVWHIRMRMNGSQWNEKCSVTTTLEWQQVFVRSLSTTSLVCFVNSISEDSYFSTKDFYFNQKQWFTVKNVKDINRLTVIWIICWLFWYLVSAVWTVIPMAHIHCRGSIDVQVMYCYFFLPQGKCIFSKRKIIFGWSIPLNGESTAKTMGF